jgi:hypothetical protein
LIGAKPGWQVIIVALAASTCGPAQLAKTAYSNGFFVTIA